MTRLTEWQKKNCENKIKMVEVKESAAIKNLKINTNLKNTTTMKNENKCFFSISLENGITITGNNPNDVQHFLLQLQLACTDSFEFTKFTSTEDTDNTWCDAMTEYQSMFNRAWMTIEHNTNRKD